jgi:hypothetical protein
MSIIYLYYYKIIFEILLKYYSNFQKNLIDLPRFDLNIIISNRHSEKYRI